MREARLRLAACALLVLAVGVNASGTVLTHFTTEMNTDWTTAGLGGLRTIGAGTIALAGVSGPVSRAYLYWNGPTNTTTASGNITFAGSPVTGTLLGLSDDNCWGFSNSHSYRADVTSLVTGNGNYAVGGLIKPNVEINGVSLLVFYNDGNPGNNRDVYIYDGNDANQPNIYDPNEWGATLGGINYIGGPASIVFGVTDGQSFSDPAVLLNAVTLMGAGANFDGVSVPGAGYVSPSGGNLWDIKSWNLTPFLTPGLNSLALSNTLSYTDCLGLVHIAVDVPAIPEPATLSLLGLGGLGLLRRRRRQR
jgi:hypothetical protein